MAFMGIILSGAFLIIAILVIVTIITTVTICITLGIILVINKKNKAAVIPFSVAGSIIAIIVIILLIGNISSRFHRVETPDGTRTTISSQIYHEYLTTLSDYGEEENSHLAAKEKLKDLINEEPVLVHCENFHHKKVLDYALEYCDVEMAEIAVENGALLDDYVSSPLPYTASLECLYGGYTGGYRYHEHGAPPIEDMYTLTEYLIDNGAQLEWKICSYDDHPNVLFEAVAYICYDNYVEKEELKLLKLVIDSGCPTDATSHDKWYTQHDFTALDLLEQGATGTEEGIDLYNGNYYIPDWETVLKNIE